MIETEKSQDLNALRQRSWTAFDWYFQQGFSTPLAMILVTPQHQLKRLSNLTRRRSVIFSIAVLLTAYYGVASQLSPANRSSIHADRTRSSVPVLSPGGRLVSQLSWSCPTWSLSNRHPFAVVIGRIATRHVGNPTKPLRIATTKHVQSRRLTAATWLARVVLRVSRVP